jgi:hypothetical protein
MPPLRRVLPALAVLAALPGCGVTLGDGPSPAAAKVTKRQLALMVLPRKELGRDADGLRLSPLAGHRANAAEAETTIDPDDDGAALRDAGRVGGYHLDYSAPDGVRKGVLEVGTSVELFASDLEASRYLHDQADDFEFLRGKPIAPRVRLAASERFDPGEVGEEARALTATIRAGKQRLHGTLVAFRRGRIVAAATLAPFDDADAGTRARELAAALDRRVQAVLAGELTGEPEPLARGGAADPRPLALSADDLPSLRLSPAHEGRISPGRARGFLREFDVEGGTLGGSRPFYLRTLGQSFPDRATALEHMRILRSPTGARSIARKFLAAWLRGAGFRPKGLRAGPLPWRGDTAGLRFEFTAPNGRMQGAYLNVTRGRAASSVLVIGPADDVHPDDLLLLADTLRDRLAPAR